MGSVLDDNLCTDLSEHVPHLMLSTVVEVPLDSEIAHLLPPLIIL